MFYLHGDESGKLHNSDYTSFCGYIAHISLWNQFNPHWNNYRLKWQVPPIHLARIMNPDLKDDKWKKVKEIWGTSWEAKRDAMLNELSDFIRESGIVCVGAIVDSAHFRKVCAENPEFKKLYRDPIFLAFHSFVMRGIDKTEGIEKSPIGIIVDDDEEFAMKVYQQLNSLRKALDPQLAGRYDERTTASLKRVKDRIHSITFVNDEFCPGVQAADMIAYEARRIMVERITNPDATSALYDDLTFRRTHQPRFYTPAVIDELNVSLKEAIADGTITV
jgi:hypothetical protein